MPVIPDSARELLKTGPLAHVVTIDPDGTPHVTLSWAGFEGDELVMATFFGLDQKKVTNLRRDPRVVVSFQSKEPGDGPLWPYLVVEGQARIEEGGALEVMDRLAEHYIGPGAVFPMRDAPPGLVYRITIDRIYGQGPWYTWRPPEVRG
jgi:PPOX class probable F420-dependent enzyme